MIKFRFIRIDKILLSFVLPILCFLISVSNAYEFGSSPIDCSLGNGSEVYSVSSPILGVSSYSYFNSNSIIVKYLNNPSDETYLTDYNNMLTTLKSEGIDIIIFRYNDRENINYYQYICFLEGLDVGFLDYSNDPDNFCFTSKNDGVYSTVSYGQNIQRPWLTTKSTTNGTRSSYSNVNELYYSSISIKQLSGTYSSATWDGTSYYYKVESDEPDTPSLPSNSDIAQAVQSFYDSDYYKNSKDFTDFIVLYNTTNGNYSFIGHTLGNVLGQVIIPPDYRYQGKLYTEQWWKFFIDENQGASPYGTFYHLYSTNNSSSYVISDDGVGKISELLNLDFSTKSVIVYSTTDYPVRTYVLDETTGDYTYTDGVIEGDQYTYDENLDPTVNGYNPLDNFVTVDPSQTIVDGADFDGLSSSFEEHKSIFSFTESMQWLISANNKLSNYFLGFIVMCALFITLSRVMKG